MDNDRCSLCIIMSLCDTKVSFFAFNPKVALLWTIAHSFFAFDRKFPWMDDHTQLSR